MDVLTLQEIRDGLRSEMRPDHLRIYEFEMDLQSALLQMAFAGISVDTQKRDELVHTTQAEKARLEGLIHQLCEAIGYYEFYRNINTIRFSNATNLAAGQLPCTWADWTSASLAERKAWKQAAGAEATERFQKSLKDLSAPFNPNSSAQKMRLLYHFFGIDTNEISANDYPDFLPPWGRTKGLKEIRTRSASNEYTPGVDRDCLEKLAARAGDDTGEAAYWALPFINLCTAHADAAKTLQFLNCKLDVGWFYSSFGAVTETGRLSSKKSAFGNRGWNSQNVTPPLRIIFTTPTGYKAATPDYEQIESRMVAARCFMQFSAIRYMAATECGDLHSLACATTWDHLPWPEDFTIDWTIKHGPFPKDMIKAAKALAKHELYRGKSYRDCSKTMGHAKNYWGKAKEVSKRSHIPLQYVEHYYEVNDAMFPEIGLWHAWIIEQVQVNQEYSTIFGRPRRFFGRPSDDSTIREAIAHDGQSPAADYTNLGLLQIHKAALRGELPVDLFLQKHDEIGVRYRIEDEVLVTAAMTKIMEQHFLLTAPNGSTRDWYVPVEMQVGWNLGHSNDANPDGLVVWRGSDSRTRQRDPFSLAFLRGAQ
jgi:hypothetical protein